MLLRTCAKPRSARWGLGVSACALAAGLAGLAGAQQPNSPSASPAPGRTANALPALGDGSALSAAAERRLGDRIAASIFRDPDYLDDAILGDYLQGIWQPLMQAARVRGELSPEIEERFAWRLMLVRDRSVNAFALPGGYMGVHTGLIGVVSSADELAAVLAHELSHVTQRHIARLTSQQQAQAPWMIGAMILGVLAASKSPDAANAAIVGGQALAVQGQLNFSRDMEREADRVGYGVMTEAGFDGRGAAGMFDKLQQASRLNDNGSFPYLRSHPLSTERMAEARARQQAAANSAANTNSRSPQELRDAALLHGLMSARARVLSSPGVDALRAMQVQAGREMAASPAKPESAAASLYAGAMAASRLRESAAAEVFLARLQALVAGAPRAQEQAAFLAIELDLQAGKPPVAQVSAEAAKSRAGLLLQTRMDLASGDLSRVAASGERLQTWVATNAGDAAAWQALAQVWGQQQQTVRAIRAEAEARVALLDNPAALDRMRAAQSLVQNTRGAASADPNMAIEASIIDARTRQLAQSVRQQALEDKLDR